MVKRAAITVDWLRKGRNIEDVAILRQLISDSMDNSLQASQRNLALFEKSYDLAPNPMTPLSDEALDRVLGISKANEIEGMNDALSPKGVTLESQIQSLLPRSLAPELKASLVYVLSRAVTGHTPKSEDWMWAPSPAKKRKSGKESEKRKRNLCPIPKHLDSLTAALMTVLVVSRLSRQGIQWLPAIWQFHVEQLRTEHLRPILAKLNTTITVNETRTLLESAVSSITSEIPGEPVAKDIIDGWLPLLATFEDNAALADCRVTDAGLGRSDPISAREYLRRGIIVRLGAGKISVRTQFSPSSRWGVLALRADGPCSGIMRNDSSRRRLRWISFEGILDVLRRDIGILAYDPLLKVSAFLSGEEVPGKPNASDVMNSTGLRGRAAYYTLNRFALVLNERFLLLPGSIGLRYRYIFSPMQKPVVQSKGIVEKMLLSDSIHSSLTVHLEPSNSMGPVDAELPVKREPGKEIHSFQVAANEEIISMRLDLFDTESKSWCLSLDQTGPTRPDRTSLWLYRDSTNRKKTPQTLTQRELDLVAALCGFRGNASARRWYLQKLGYPRRTAGQVLPKLLTENVLRALYHPALEYLGLGNGLIIGARLNSSRDLNEFVDRVVVMSPFAQVQYDKESKSAVASIRTPHLQATYIDGAVGQWLDSIGADYVSATMQWRRTYWLTALHRLYCGYGEPWTNPWE
ncbi:MAG: hypothetical protein ACFFAY_12515 [Promethearchaeota archaeon]